MTKKELQQLIAQGEGYTIEFKRELNADFKKEMVAFANASGGYILIGVEDNGTVKKLKIDNSFRSVIQQHASECDPPVDIKMQEIDDVLVVTVAEGKEKPYRSTNGFYLRVGPNCQKLSTAKIIEFVEKSGRVQFDERVRKDVNFEESLDASLVDQFMTSAKIKNVFQDKVHILSSLGVVKQVSGTRYFTNAGILFFTTTPSSIIKQAQITCVAFNGTEKVDILDRKDFKDDLITNIDSGLAFLRRHLNEASHIKGLKREDVLEIPLVALREALVNAVAHRNYLETGAHIMIEIYSNRVIISNPGGLPDGLTEKDFGKYSLSRNPVISDLLLRAGLIEKLGTGVNRIKDLIKEAKLPEPEFHFNNFFAVTFFRESAEINQIKGGAKGGAKSSAKLTDRQQEVLNLIIDNNQITKTELAEKLGINVSAVQKQIENLKQKGILKRIGPKFGGNWEVIKVV